MGNVMRYRIEPRDGPSAIAGKRLGISLPTFDAALPNLISRGFPKADPDTGNYDLTAIDKWCDARHPHLFGGTGLQALDASRVANDRIAAMQRGHRGKHQA
jgi:hypothetical protein